MTKAVGDSSWTPDALDVLERAYDHYGGIETWRALRKIQLIPGRLSGFVPWMKGGGRTFGLPAAFEIMPHERRVRFLGYPDEEHVGIFQNGMVRLERCDGKVVVEIENHRRSFRGFGIYRRWSPIDALYFFGYALAHYHSLPFTLADARLLRTRTEGTRADRVSVLEVELPPDLPTHCRRQSFYFDKTGRLTRHDYHAEIVGVWARGAHFWNRETSLSGFPISLERHVAVRCGSTAWPLTALHATFTDADVELDRTGV